MNQVNHREVLRHVAEAVPVNCRANIVVIGSLAAAYAYFDADDKMVVRTKDVDCMLKPHKLAAEKGSEIVKQLLSSGWKRREIGDHRTPGTDKTPDENLPAMRLYPPGIAPTEKDAWFIELLTEPESTGQKGKKWTRMIVGDDHFGLPSFQYLSITAFQPTPIEELGIHHAQPEMMALANMLEHQEIKPDRMSGFIVGRSIKRSNKDLGRVLGIGFLAQEKGLIDFDEWAYVWKDALQNCYPETYKTIAKRVGLGVQQLLNSEEDLEEAHYTCANGLLASFSVTVEDLKETGERILGEAVKKLHFLIDK